MRRPRRSIPAALVAAAIAAACGLVAVALIQRLLGEPPVLTLETVTSRLHATSWRDTIVLVTGCVAAGIGLLLLLAALRPGRPVTLSVESPSGIAASASRQGLRRTLRDTAAHVDGISDAKLRLHRRRLRTRVRTRRTVREGLDEAVRTALERRLDELSLAKRPTVKVRVRGIR